MNEKHCINKHSLLTQEGKLIGGKISTSADPAAESTYKVPDGFKGTLWTISLCNLHDPWLAEFNV